MSVIRFVAQQIVNRERQILRCKYIVVCERFCKAVKTTIFSRTQTVIREIIFADEWVVFQIEGRY